MNTDPQPRPSSRAPPSDREQAELIRGLYRNAPVGVAGALFGVAVLCWVLIYIAPDRAPRVELWFALTVVVAVWQLALCQWYWRARSPDAGWRPWARRFVLVSLAEGARWGFGSLWLAAPAHAEQQIWVCMVVACAASSSVSSLGSYVPAFYALLFPAMVPFVVWGAFQSDPRYWALALLAFVLTSSIAWLGYGQSRSLAEALRLRFENLDLAEDLRLQKDIAEQANLAKSQFLAAASHDLRQPIHAVGLLIGAAQRAPMSSGVRRLTAQISTAIDAMTGLFNSLLDISQLDAGVVRPASQVFALGPLLGRICAEQAVELEGRPVRLRVAATSAVVATDPILLERMLRNLIANAVRHTRTGRILVGCRRGARVSIQVWDTGPGIAPAHREAIFQEYTQLSNPERDRTQGLGLGLAITRRLSDLLDCPVALRSWVGSGSVFSISVPAAPAASLAAAPPPFAPPVLAPGLAFVVDDEVAVRQSTADLLRAWGFEVVAAGSGEALLARADPGRRPDIVICDWRLRGQVTGLDVIALVHGVFGADIPALLITGDTAPERLRDAHATGYALLHKPVAPGRLRAAIGNLLREGVKPSAPG